MHIQNASPSRPYSPLSVAGLVSPSHHPMARARVSELLRLSLDGVLRQGSDAGLPVTLRTVRAGECLVHEGTTAEALYFVCAGTFKVFHTDETGYEQVLAFAIRGEVLGFDALCAASHPVAISALEASAVYVVPRSELQLLHEKLPHFGELLHQSASLTLAHSRDLVDILAPVASEVRLARFLLQHSRRMAQAGQSPNRFLLRMGRREIASLLGMAHETVSRRFTSLCNLGLLLVNDREVEILDMHGLNALARSTRRDMEAAQRAPSQPNRPNGHSIPNGPARPGPCSATQPPLGL